MAKLADLPGAAENLLAAFVSQLKAQGVTLPERQYRAPGQMIVWDGEQLTVRLLGWHQGEPGQEYGMTMQPAAVHVFAQFGIDLVRSVTGMTDGTIEGAIPTAAQMDADGATFLGDASALFKAATTIYQQDWQTQGRAFGVTFPGEGFVIGPHQTLGPEGDLAANRLQISLSVD